jgi:hypothetical protein
MLAANSKGLAVAATILSVLGPSVHACLTVSGSTYVGLGIGGTLTAVDNGLQTCSGSISSGDKNLRETPCPSR